MSEQDHQARDSAALHRIAALLRANPRLDSEDLISAIYDITGMAGHVTDPDPDGLTPDEVETLAVTAAELWDPEDAGADEALSQRQREVLAKVHALYGPQVNGTW